MSQYYEIFIFMRSKLIVFQVHVNWLQTSVSEQECLNLVLANQQFPHTSSQVKVNTDDMIPYIQIELLKILSFLSTQKDPNFHLIILRNCFPLQKFFS